ncbi:hypothetical protein B0I35DRAFT_438584, partial [Stachybotrys elegans]
MSSMVRAMMQLSDRAVDSFFLFFSPLLFLLCFVVLYDQSWLAGGVPYLYGYGEPKTECATAVTNLNASSRGRLVCCCLAQKERGTSDPANQIHGGEYKRGSGRGGEL